MARAVGEVTKRLFQAISFVFVGGLAAFVWMYGSVDIRDIAYQYQITRLGIFPSADLAYTYASQYFDSADPFWYDRQKASVLYGFARDVNPGHPFVYRELSLVALRQGNLKDANTFAEVQARLHGATDAQVQFIRGNIELRSGQYSDALKDLAIYLQNKPDEPRVLYMYAYALVKTDQLSEAEEFLSKGVQKHPDNPWLLILFAYVQNAIGRNDLARNTALRAAEASYAISDEQFYDIYPDIDPDMLLARRLSFANYMFTIIRTIVHEEKINTVPSEYTSYYSCLRRV